MAIFILAAACVPAGDGSGASAARGSSESLKVPEDSFGLRIYNGDVTRVSESEYIVRTAAVENAEYNQGYFDIPISVQQPFAISFDVDYPGKDIMDTVEIFIGDQILGYKPGTGKYWSIFKDYAYDQRVELKNDIGIEEYNFGQKNTFELSGIGETDTKNKSMYFQIRINHMVHSQYYPPYKKDIRFGVRVRSSKGIPKTAIISNLVILSSDDDLDSGRVQQAIRNTLTNANKYGGPNTEYYELQIKRAKYGGKNKAEILKNEKEYIDKRVREIDESD